jgi:hypothetical protein
MAIFKKLVTAYRCERFGYRWLPRFRDQPPPTVCADLECKSAWNKPRQPRRRKRAVHPRRWRGATASTAAAG